MDSNLTRKYCLTHPSEITRLYGLDVFLGALFGGRKSLLERISDKYLRRRSPTFGVVGDAYRIAALFELRVARIYEALAERFQDILPAHQLFKALEAEEKEHARMMNICLHSVDTEKTVEYIPSVRDPEIRAQMQHLRKVQRRVPSMSLDEALAVVEDVEKGEVNTIFGKLLAQVSQPEVHWIKSHMHKTEDHSVSVPRRIQELRQQLDDLGLSAA